MRKVRKGQVFRYVPVGMDRWDPPYNVRPGDVVQVVHLPGCPRPGTMNHAHVAHLDGTFAGLVHVNSLVPVKGSVAGRPHSC